MPTHHQSSKSGLWASHTVVSHLLTLRSLAGLLLLTSTRREKHPVFVNLHESR